MVDSIWPRSLECHHVCQLILHHGQHSSLSLAVRRSIPPFLQLPQEISEVLVIATCSHAAGHWDPFSVTANDCRVIEVHSGRFLPVEQPTDMVLAGFGDTRSLTLGLRACDLYGPLLTFAPDGGRLAVACISGLYIVEPIVGPIQRVLPSHAFDAMVFSPCGANIALWGEEDGLHFLDAQHVLKTVSPCPLGLHMYSMTYAPDGGSLAAVGGGWSRSKTGYLLIYSIILENFTHELHFDTDIFIAEYSPTNDALVACFSPRSDSPLGVLHVQVDFDSWYPAHNIVLPSIKIDCIVYTPSGEYLTAISGGSVHIVAAWAMEVVYSCLLIDIEFARNASMTSLVYRSRRSACGGGEVGWDRYRELLVPEAPAWN